ncbi:MAG: hypothetical protein K2X87_21220 [Gemmataceae bacterium]|nr:hypothetical protein [Gemmataceae bacterium]
MRRIALTTLALALAAGTTPAGPIRIETVADTHTSVPGGTGDFRFFTFPVIGPQVVFYGTGRMSTDRGIYAGGPGSLGVLYNTATPIPGGTGTFTGLTVPAIAGGRVAFLGSGAGGQQGVYTDIGGSLVRVADLSTPQPGGAGPFTRFGAGEGPADTDGVDVVFGAAGAGGLAGLYRTTAGGGLAVVADTNTPQPGGGGAFQGVSGAAIDGPDVAFFGSREVAPMTFRDGIYVESGGLLTVVADSDTPVPGGTGNFFAFGGPSVADGVVTFVGMDGRGGPLGIYTWEAGALSVLADTNTPVPGGVGTFSGFGFEVSVDGRNVAFFGVDSAGTGGIYADLGGGLFEVLDTNTRIDGRRIVGASLGLSTDQLSGNRIAFYALLEDGTFGVYTATAVPEPSGLAAAGLGGLTLAGYARRRAGRRAA